MARACVTISDTRLRNHVRRLGKTLLILEVLWSRGATNWWAFGFRMLELSKKTTVCRLKAYSSSTEVALLSKY